MADKVETAILNLLAREKGSITLRPRDIPKRARLGGCNKVKVDQALAALRVRGKITTSLDHKTHQMTLRSVNVRA